MTPPSRDRISVDLRGLKTALIERSRAQGQTPSDFVRALLAAALRAEAEEPKPAPGTVQSGPRTRLSLRMSRDDASAVLAATRLAGQAPGDFVANLLAMHPAPNPEARRVARLLMAVCVSGATPVDWDEVERLAALPAFAVADELKNLRQEVQGEV